VTDQPQVLTDLASVDALLDEWRALAARSARSGLESPDWLLPLARNYLAGDAPRFLAWRDGGGELVGAAPLSLLADRPRWRPLRQLYFWGTSGPRMRGLVDLVATDPVRDELLDSLCAWLRSDREWDVLRILRPQFGSPTPARLRVEAGSAGWAYAGFHNPVRSTTYQLDLPDSAEGWQRHLGSKARKVMRWEVRKFADFRGGSVEAAVEDAALPGALDAVEALLRERWGEEEVYFRVDQRFRGLLRESIPLMARHGSAWASVARDESGIRGVLVSLAQNGYAMALMVAMTTDPDYRPFSLGKHLFDAGIGEAVARGCHVYDFLWIGGYKESFWHAVPRDLESAMVGRGIVGRAAARLLANREAGGFRRR
jgi:CelD/BcsL family acetyltransferase involved in cellulose biosynthesis